MLLKLGNNQFSFQWVLSPFRGLGFLLLATSASCQSKKMSGTVPQCIQSFIDSSKTTWQVGSVEEYEFQGKLVYAFGPSAQMRDGTTLIKSAECKDLCNVGGFAGLKNSNCDGENFFEKAVLRRRIWPIVK